MVRLIDIHKTDDFISAKYAPEDGEELGYVKIRIADRSVVEKELTDDDGNTGFYYVHVRNALFEMLETGDVPKERTIMWY